MATTASKSTFRAVLNNLGIRQPIPSSPDEIAPLVDRFKELLAAHSSAATNPDFSKDIVMLVVAALDLGETTAQKLYSVDEFLRSSSVIQSVLARLTNYAIGARPKISGFILVNTATSRIYPDFFATETEGLKQRDELAHIGPNGIYELVPAEMSSAFITQPGAQLQPPAAGGKPSQSSLAEMLTSIAQTQAAVAKESKP